jgi:hypothetical protein
MLFFSYLIIIVSDTQTFACIIHFLLGRFSTVNCTFNFRLLGCNRWWLLHSEFLLICKINSSISYKIILFSAYFLFPEFHRASDMHRNEISLGVFSLLFFVISVYTKVLSWWTKEMWDKVHIFQHFVTFHLILGNHLNRYIPEIPDVWSAFLFSFYSPDS